MVIMSHRATRLFLTVVVVTWNDLSVWCKEMDSKKYFLTPEALTWDEAEEVSCSSSGLKVKNYLLDVISSIHQIIKNLNRVNNFADCCVGLSLEDVS